MAYENQKTTVKTEISYMGEYMRKYKQTPEGKEKMHNASKNWRAKNKDKYIQKQKLYGETRAFAEKRIPGGFPKGFALHHAFGDDPHSFLAIPAGVHKALHSRFGRENSKCQWNPETEAFLKGFGQPFFIVYKGRVTVSEVPDLF